MNEIVLLDMPIKSNVLYILDPHTQLELHIIIPKDLEPFVKDLEPFVKAMYSEAGTVC